MMLVFREHAKRDLRWFAAYCSKAFPEGRKNAERSLRRAIELILANPFAGNPLEGMQAWQFPILRTPFVLIYSEESDSIDIIRVWDARADPVRLNEK
jgi:plasmid stabilization system protein ParE